MIGRGSVKRVVAREDSVPRSTVRLMKGSGRLWSKCDTVSSCYAEELGAIAIGVRISLLGAILSI